MNRINLLFEQQKRSEDALPNLFKGALLEKFLDSVQNRGLSLEPNHHYYEAIECYKKGITDKNDFETIFSYLFITQLSDQHRHYRTAMTCTQLFEESLENNTDLVKKLLKLKNSSESENNKSENAKILDSMRILDSQSVNKENVLKYLMDITGINVKNWNTFKRLIENSEKEQNYIKELTEHKSEMEHNSLVLFYRKMSRMLAHTLAAMCVTSGVGDEPIIKHDRTGPWHQ